MAKLRSHLTSNELATLLGWDPIIVARILRSRLAIDSSVPMDRQRFPAEVARAALLDHVRELNEQARLLSERHTREQASPESRPGKPHSQASPTVAEQPRQFPADVKHPIDLDELEQAFIRLVLAFLKVLVRAIEQCDPE